MVHGNHKKQGVYESLLSAKFSEWKKQSCVHFLIQNNQDSRNQYKFKLGVLNQLLEKTGLCKKNNNNNRVTTSLSLPY